MKGTPMESCLNRWSSYHKIPWKFHNPSLTRLYPTSADAEDIYALPGAALRNAAIRNEVPGGGEMQK